MLKVYSLLIFVYFTGLCSAKDFSELTSSVLEKVDKNCYGTVDGKTQRTCCIGYVEYPWNNTKCIPLCNGHPINGCPTHAVCTGPNTCNCSQEFFFLNNKCEPKCISGGPNARCLNGRCQGDTCLCDAGYQLNPANRHHCLPICSFPCPQGQMCVAPNICGCPYGYNLVGAQCRPVCDPPCLYGDCVAPNTCKCYNNSNLIDGICHAQCWQNCENGVCVQPNRCECKRGYLLELPTLKCVPMCIGCEFGKCVGPNNCECQKGLKYKDHKCRAYCKGCKNGECLENEKCKCNEGYKWNTLLAKCCRKRSVFSRKSIFSC